MQTCQFMIWFRNHCRCYFRFSYQYSLENYRKLYNKYILFIPKHIQNIQYIVTQYSHLYNWLWKKKYINKKLSFFKCNHCSYFLVIYSHSTKLQIVKMKPQLALESYYKIEVCFMASFESFWLWQLSWVWLCKIISCFQREWKRVLSGSFAYVLLCEMDDPLVKMNSSRYRVVGRYSNHKGKTLA